MRECTQEMRSRGLALRYISSHFSVPLIEFSAGTKIHTRPPDYFRLHRARNSADDANRHSSDVAAARAIAEKRPPIIRRLHFGGRNA